jgi:hypothetical protein
MRPSPNLTSWREQEADCAICGTRRDCGRCALQQATGVGDGADDADAEVAALTGGPDFGPHNVGTLSAGLIPVRGVAQVLRAGSPPGSPGSTLAKRSELEAMKNDLCPLGPGGVQAPPAFLTVNRFSMAVVHGRVAAYRPVLTIFGPGSQCAARQRRRGLPAAADRRGQPAGRGGGGRAQSHRRFRNTDAESVSDFGIKWMSGGTKWQCDRTLGGGRAAERHVARQPVRADQALRRRHGPPPARAFKHP